MFRPVASAFALTLALPLQAQERIPSHCIALAQGPETIHRAAFGDPLAANTVRLRYLDHASFLLETAGGLTAVTDYTGYTGVRDLVPDVVTMNNAHSTHWTADPDPRIPHVLPGWGEGPEGVVHSLDLGEMLVRNVTTDVRSYGGARANGNSIFIFEVAGLCIGHLGHLHHELDDSHYSQIGRLDVLMVPVDGGLTMGAESMSRVVSRLRSSLILPMHRRGPPIEAFLDMFGDDYDKRYADSTSIKVSLRSLPSKPLIYILKGV